MSFSLNHNHIKSCYVLPIKLENDQEEDDYAKPELRIVRTSLVDIFLKLFNFFNFIFIKNSCDDEAIKFEKENFQLKNENHYLKNLISKMRDNVKNMEEAKKEQDSNENKSYQLNKKIYVLQVILNN